MKTKIVIITSTYLHPFVEKAFEEFKEECDVTIADYTNFEHIAEKFYSKDHNKIFYFLNKLERTR